MSYMLDTNICIFAIKKHESVLAKIKANRDKGICISAITLSELDHGVCNSSQQARNRLALTYFLTLADALPYDERAAAEYGALRTDLQRRGCPIGSMDTLIAAHAKASGMVLVTNNTGEFGRVRGLALEDWSR
jgi:tRNA(fMet)-specific endonuclease VapC